MPVCKTASTCNIAIAHVEKKKSAIMSIPPVFNVAAYPAVALSHSREPQPHKRGSTDVTCVDYDASISPTSSALWTNHPELL